MERIGWDMNSVGEYLREEPATEEICIGWLDRSITAWLLQREDFPDYARKYIELHYPYDDVDNMKSWAVVTEEYTTKEIVSKCEVISRSGIFENTFNSMVGYDIYVKDAFYNVELDRWEFMSKGKYNAFFTRKSFWSPSKFCSRVKTYNSLVRCILGWNVPVGTIVEVHDGQHEGTIVIRCY